MEIDFLGLSSSSLSQEFQEERCHNDAFPDSGVETSLSLCTTPSRGEFLNFCQNNKKTWEFPSDAIIPSCSNGYLTHYNHTEEHKSHIFVPKPVYHSTPATGFLYDLSERSTNLSRNIPQLPPELASSVTQLPTKPSRGHTPTVAMARRATLARFLEKRLHRMNKARTAQLMGKSLCATKSEVCNTTTTTRSNNSIVRL